MLFGLVGKSRSGKTTTSLLLQDILGHDTEAQELSAPLKNICNIMFGIPIDLMNSQDGKEITDPEQKMTVREIMQAMGDMFDNHFRTYFPNTSSNDPIWVRQGNMLHLNEMIEQKRNTVISGIRTKDQVEWVLRAGGVVLYVERDTPAGEVYSGQHHSTETGMHALKGLCHEVIENNGTTDDLLSKLYAVVKKYSTPLN